MQSTNILIIGGGLTGLATAYFLQKQGVSAQIIEARSRLGGRIHTLYDEEKAPVELGATWLGRKHRTLIALLEELGIDIFKQELSDRAIYEPISTSPPQLVRLPPNHDPSFRIAGGTSTIIQALARHLKEEQIHLEEFVETIHKSADSLMVKTNKQSFQASHIISTLPPYLLVNSIAIEPALPANFVQIAQQTHTWMGDSIKIALTFEEPFWRNPKSSGTIFSSVGPIPELYEHSNVENTKHALKGFLNGSYFSLTKEERLVLILKQLEKYYGTQIHSYLTYEETVWRKEKFTFSDYKTHILPHENNGHAVFQQAFWDGRLFIAGSETATQHSGYMDGAVASARWVCAELEKKR